MSGRVRWFDFTESDHRYGGWGESQLSPYCPLCQVDGREPWDKGMDWVRRELPRVSALSDRELQVFHAMACGPTNDELAEGLEMTVRTVKFHLENIRGKLGGITRVQTCLLAAHHRIATCPTGH
ncbi:response regulator transcription factor [Streptomyces sp. NPDC002104]